MTVPSTYTPTVVAANGVTTSFPFSFPVLAASHLRVELDGVALTNITDYTVTGVGNPAGGTADLVVTPASGVIVTIQRAMPLSRETDFQNNGDLLADTLNDDQDSPVLMLQQVNEQVSRALRIALSSSASAQLPAIEAGYYIRAKLDGSGFEFAPGTGTPLGEFLQSGAGAVGRSYDAKVGEVVSVKDFGAVGDGVTDDTAAFEAALTYSNRVYVPGTADSYCVDNVQIPSGRTLIGDGITSKITPFTVGAAYLFEPDAGASDVTIRDLWLDAPKATYPAKIIVVAGTPTRMVVSDCRITGGSYPVFMVSSTECVVQRCVVSDFVTTGIVLETSAVRSKVLGCTITGTGSSAHGIQFTGATGCIIDSNTVLGAGVFGIFGDNSVSCVVTNNTTRETVREGINLNRCRNCTISDNGVSFLAAGSVGTDFGISLWGSGGISRNNVISGNTVVNSFLSGIALAGDEDVQAYNVVIGNTIENCGRSNLADTAGVVIYGTDALNNLVVDNVIFDNVGVLRYGVFDDPVVGAPVGTVIRGNLVQGASVANVSRSASSLEAMNGRTLATYTPVVTSTTGTITTLGTVSAKYYEVEKMVYVQASIAITTNGTGATSVNMTLPFTASANKFTLVGRENAVTGNALTAFIGASSASAVIYQYDNAYPGGDGRELLVSGWYERA